MNRVEFSAAGSGALVRADLGLGPGMNTVVALTADGADEVVRLASGISEPSYGSVLVDGANPHRRPDVRRKIGSLFAVEAVSEARNVEAAVAVALLMHRSSKSPISVLESFELGGLAMRSPATLSAGEARAVALALAVSAHDGILVLHEPLATPAGRARVADALADAASHGASVLAVTASLRDASDLGGRCFPLRFGRVGGETPLASLGATGESVLEMVVRTDDPRRLASALSVDPAFSGVRWEDRAGSGEVVVSGREADRVALGVLRGSHGSGAKILAMWQRTARRASSVEGRRE